MRRRNTIFIDGTLLGKTTTADNTILKADRTIYIEVVEGTKSTLREQMQLLNQKQEELYLILSNYA